MYSITLHLLGSMTEYLYKMSRSSCSTALALGALPPVQRFTTNKCNGSVNYNYTTMYSEPWKTRDDFEFHNCPSMAVWFIDTHVRIHLTRRC